LRWRTQRERKKLRSQARKAISEERFERPKHLEKRSVELRWLTLNQEAAELDTQN
jgi:hypothetical protein